jgi:hypothetical protein
MFFKMSTELEKKAMKSEEGSHMITALTRLSQGDISS